MAAIPENADRLVDAHWEETSSSSSQDMYEAQLSVYVYDRLGIVADISVALSDMRVFLLQINTVRGNTDKSIVNLKISCKNVEHYHSIVSRLKSIDGVADVTRGFS
jgi:GTP pyrophosphokinase